MWRGFKLQALNTVLYFCSTAQCEVNVKAAVGESNKNKT